MAVIPSDIRFVGIGTQVDMTERKTDNLNALTQPYTMQDIVDTVSAGGTSVMNAGTGALSIVGSGSGNTASADFGFVGGGLDNTASATYATIGGGRQNTAFATYSTLAGGWYNKSGYASFIGGGMFNCACGNYGTIAGGSGNVAGDVIGQYAGTVGGGFSNSANKYATTIGGGGGNVADAYHATIAGGVSNTASQCRSFIGGGRNNKACGCNAVIGGGYCNTASGNDSSVLGGRQNTASGNCSSILGGCLNSIPVSLTNVHVIGSGLSVGTSNYTYVNNLCNVGGGTSDARLKENIQPLTFGLQELSGLEPVEYNFIDDESKKTKYGFLAQNIQSVMPSLITYHPTDLVDGEPILQFDKDAVWSSMVNALKELQERIVKLENK